MAMLSRGHNFQKVYIGGHATVQLGDVALTNRDIFQTGSVEERREALRNALFYEGMNARELQISLSEIGTASFDWVQSSTLSQWLMSMEQVFWIVGKPGSGKSTLMKHLIMSKWTLDHLRTSKIGRWKITYFYFDYRAGRATANDTLGMLKQFVHQLSIDLQFEDNVSLQKLFKDEADEDDYIAILSQAIRDSTMNICAFIDGLDEYEGDLWNLCECLDRLQDQTGLKMCLASRPEAAFVSFLGNRPNVSMQEYNDSSIQLYIERKVSRTAAMFPSVHDLFPASLQQSIRQRAQGVILWAKLVVDEMLKICDETTTTKLLTSYLEALPQELEQLYDRILNKVNAKFHGEVALVIHMLAESGGSLEKILFYQTWSFLQVHLLRFAIPAHLNYKTFDARLNVLLGNMVDTTMSSDGVLVRLMHKSLSAYLSRSNWMISNLPTAVKENHFDSFFWHRLYLTVLSEAATQEAIRPEMLTSLAQGMFSWDRRTSPMRLYSEDTHPYKRHAFKKELAGQVSDRWLLWQRLLALSLDAYPSHVVVSNEDNDLLGDAAAAAAAAMPAVEVPRGASRVLIAHCAFCDKCRKFIDSPWRQLRAQRLYEQDALHTAIDISHRDYGWLLDPRFDRTEDMPYQVKSDLFDLLLTSRSTALQGQRLLHMLFEKGMRLEGRHLCALEIFKAFVKHNGGNAYLAHYLHAFDVASRYIEGPSEKAHERSAHHADYSHAFDMGSEHRRAALVQSQHDPHCKYSDTNNRVFVHWCDTDFDDPGSWLNIFLRVGEQVDAWCGPDGPPMHTVLARYLLDWKFGQLQRKLKALADAGASSKVKGEHGDVAQHAERIATLYSGSLPKEFDMMVQALKQHQHTGIWPEFAELSQSNNQASAYQQPQNGIIKQVQPVAKTATKVFPESATHRQPKDLTQGTYLRTTSITQPQTTLSVSAIRHPPTTNHSQPYAMPQDQTQYASIPAQYRFSPAPSSKPHFRQRLAGKLRFWSPKT